MDDYEIHRTRAGYWQKSAGAWCWTLRSKKDRQLGNDSIGSTYPANRIAKHPEAFDVLHLHWPDIELVPNDKWEGL